MELKNFTYLLILATSLLVPLILSFEKKVQYYKNLKYILPAIVVTTAVFLVWDINFTKAGIWSFNPEYTLGKNIKGMPVEEWLFFLVVPYCCVFIYEVLKYYLGKYDYSRPFKVFSLLLAAALGITGYCFRSQAYTFLTFCFPAALLGYLILRNKFTPHLTMFYFCYLVSSIPFMIVNGILTSLPVVEYNQAHILNIRVMNVPVEDFSYSFLMLLMVISIYESLKEARHY